MMKILLVMALTIALALPGSVVSAQEKGGKLVLGDREIPFQPLGGKATGTLQWWQKANRARPDSGGGKRAAVQGFFCDGEICGCVGGLDCLLMFSSNVCNAPMHCGQLIGGETGCWCLSSHAPIDFANDPAMKEPSFQFD